jgi:hypothetical protein
MQKEMTFGPKNPENLQSVFHLVLGDSISASINFRGIEFRDSGVS